MDASAALSQLIEKLLLHRGKRDFSCRVYPPAAGLRSYSVVLEGNRIREQFFLEPHRVEQFALTGNEQYVLTDVRTALRNLERLVVKHKPAGRASRG